MKLLRMLREGRALLPIDHPPDFAARWGHAQPPARAIVRIIERHADAQRAYLRRLAAFRDDLATIPALPEGVQPGWRQNWFPPLDGISLYGALAAGRPRHFVEIGSGHSTLFARRAIADHATGTRIISIDPFPRADVAGVADEVHRARLESIDLSVFDRLEPGDVVLFDGSHRVLQNSDVTVFFLDVLPALPPGVLVGIHDIFWPNDYPVSWRRRYYSEQYILGVYMMAHGDAFPLVLACNWAARALREECRVCLTTDGLRRAGDVSGCTLWFRVP